MRDALFGRPALLFLPASNPRAIAKARELKPDIVILDLEDAVKSEDKSAAREAAVAAVEEAWPCPVAIRVNADGTEWHEEDCGAIRNAQCDFVVLPSVRHAGEVAAVVDSTGKPAMAMIETAAAVLAAPAIAREAAALIAGTNDLRAGLRIPEGANRDAFGASLQLILLAARAAGIAAFDGVFNRLEDEAGFRAEAAEGWSLGFDGKSLIHPSQIEPCRAAWAPSDDDIARATRLIAAATGGAERFEGAMVEDMHVDAARRLLRRAGVGESLPPA